MAAWHLTTDPEQPRADRWQSLPPPAMPAMSGPEGYVPDAGAVDAVNVAIALGQPLLLTGEPGCGKTELAHWVAWKLGLDRANEGSGRPEYALRFDVKTTTTARDLFYSINTIERFHAAQSDKGNTDPRLFMEFQAYGKAILFTRPPDEARGLVGDRLAHPGRPQRSVVLLDEIDKAPVDVPNDLLNEVENMQFFIPELNKTIAADPDLRPIVIMTSNSEKALPEPFLRRCVYYHVDYPKPERLKLIVANRINSFPRDCPLLGDTLALFEELRRRSGSLLHVPGTAELLGFLLALRDRGFTATDRLAGREDWVPLALRTLTKKREDLDAVREPLNGVAKTGPHEPA